MSGPAGAGPGTPEPLAALLDRGLDGLRLDLPPAGRATLLRYLALVAQWNRVYNLTAVRDPEQMLSQHLLDSLAAVGPLRRHTAGRAVTLLDVGSGAGLPGLVVAVACPEIAVTCVDAVAKKSSFIRHAAAELGLGNVTALHARVEHLAPAPWDVIASRAFASLVDFTAATRALLAPQGCWLAMKGQPPHDELRALPADVETVAVEPLQVPLLGAARCLVWLRPRMAPLQQSAHPA